MQPRPLRASFAARAILKVGIFWLAASTSVTATGTATSHRVEGDALSRLHGLVAAKDTGALYDFLNRSWLRGDIEATPDIEALALAVIRNPANDRDATLTRRVFLAAVRGYRSPELFRFFLTTFKSDLGESQRQVDPTYSRLDEDARNLLHADAAIPHLDAELTAVLPLLPDSCAGRPLLNYLKDRPAAFDGLRDLYLRLSLEPPAHCRNSASYLTPMLAGLHTAAATEAILQRLHQWLDHRPLSPGRDDAINELLSVLGDQPLEAQVDLDAVERAVMTTPLYHEFNRLKIKTSLERQRELADRGTHYWLQNLSDAIVRGDLPAVQSLMERGVDPNAVTIPWGKTYRSPISGGTTLLNLAVQHDNADVVQFLVAKGADVDRADSNDAARRPLHHEVSRNSEESAAVVALLIEAGASLDLRDGAGYSALACAASSGSLRLVKALVEAGAPVDTRLTPPIDRNGKPAYNPMPWAVAATPLMLAAASGQTETADYLIQHHADVNATTTTDVTALRVAVSDGQAAMVGLLLDNGANPRAPAPHAPPPLNLSLVALAQAQHESYKATNPIGHLYVLDILAQHGLHANPVAAAKNAAEEAYLKCCYVPLSH